MAERMLPQNVDAEQGLLGSILIDASALEVVNEFMRSGYFYRDAHQEIYSAILRVHARNEAVDFITVGEELERTGKDEATGGSDYLTSLINYVPTSANAEYYAHIIERKWQSRELISAAGRIAASAYEEDENALEQAESLIYQINQGEMSRQVATHNEALDRYMMQLIELHEANEGNGVMSGVPTEYPLLNHYIGGFRGSKLVIVAGRPGDGKTSLVLCFADHAVKEGFNVCFFSLEMEEDELMQRWVAMEAHVDSTKLRDGKLSDVPDHNGKTEWDKVVEATARLQSRKGKLFIDDTPGNTTTAMRSKARRLHSEHGLDLIIVDYLQIARVANDDGRKYPDRRLEVEEISRSLKRLARELKVPVIALAQLNREVERREKRVAKLSDLREAGGIENDADIALFINKDPDIPKDQQNFPVNLMIEKNRHGQRGMVPLFFRGDETKFYPGETRQLEQ